jgi:mono/diheme cytochrome c family protein
VANQLDTFAHLGVLTGLDPATAPAFPAITSSAATEQRARAYLDVNCASCHPGGGAKPNFLFDTPAAQMTVCNETPSSAFDGGTRLVVPGDAGMSILYNRVRATGPGRMPLIGSRRVHSEGVQLLEAWINEKTGCP